MRVGTEGEREARIQPVLLANRAGQTLARVGIVLDHRRLTKLVKHLLDHPIVEMQWREAWVADERLDLLREDGREREPLEERIALVVLAEEERDPEDARELVGGCVVTEELWPGFKVWRESL